MANFLRVRLATGNNPFHQEHSQEGFQEAVKKQERTSASQIRPVVLCKEYSTSNRYQSIEIQQWVSQPQTH